MRSSLRLCGYHRIIESFELEGILKGYLVHLPSNEQGREMREFLKELREF